MINALDTTALLRLLLKDIPEQHEKVKKLTQQRNTVFFISDTAIIELVFILERHYEFSRPLIKEAVLALCAVENMVLTTRTLQNALETYVKHSMLSFKDCYLAEEAAAKSATPLWTFDKKLATQNTHAQLIM